MPDNPENPEVPKKKIPLKMLIILGVVMLIEAIAIGGAFLLAGGPSDVEATAIADDPEAEMNQPVEVIVTSGKFQNTRSGQPFLYDTEIYITVKRKNQDLTNARKEAMQARIDSHITTIFRRAEPAHLNEPDRQTLKRQVKAAMNNLFGNDPDGEPFVLDVIVPNMKRFSTDL